MTYYTAHNGLDILEYAETTTLDEGEDQKKANAIEECCSYVFGAIPYVPVKLYLLTKKGKCINMENALFRHIKRTGIVKLSHIFKPALLNQFMKWCGKLERTQQGRSNPATNFPNSTAMYQL